MRRIRWSCEGLTSVHNEYTGYTVKHLLLRHMYNLLLPMLMCYVLKPYALRLPTGGCSLVKCWPATALLLCVSCRVLSVTLYCVVTYILLVQTLVERYFGTVHSDIRECSHRIYRKGNFVRTTRQPIVVISPHPGRYSVYGYNFPSTLQINRPIPPVNCIGNFNKPSVIKIKRWKKILRWFVHKITKC